VRGEGVCVPDCLAIDVRGACSETATVDCTGAAFLFNERKGNATSWQGNAVAVVGSAVQRVAGYSGGGVRFNRTNSIEAGVNLGAPMGTFGTADFAVAFRFKTTGAGGDGDVLGNRSVGSHGNFFQIRYGGNGSFAAEVDQDENGTNYIAVGTGAGLNDGNWHHLAVVRAANTLTIYNDGQLTQTNSAAGTALIGNGNPLLFGATNLDIIEGARGDYDDLRIYRGALTAPQVATLAGTCAPL